MSSNTQILIKRSGVSGNDAPSALANGELGYSYASNTLFIGTPDGLGALEIGAWSNLANLTAGTYGGATSIPVITVDEHGAVTNVWTSEISTTLSLSSDDGSNTMSLVDGTLTFTGANGITTYIEANTSEVIFGVDDTIFRSNTSLELQFIDSSVQISGNLTVLGNVTSIDVQTLNISDPLIYLAGNNYTSDIVDIGFVGNYFDGDTQRHAGVFRHAGDKDFYVFDNYDEEPDVTNVIDVNNASFHVANLHANIIGNVSATLIQSKAFLANQGTPDGTANAGFSFSGDEGGYDTGMFSPTDGQLQFWSNADKAGEINPDNDGTSFGVGSAVSNQGYRAIALGFEAGATDQGSFAVALGLHAGQTSQGSGTVAVGHSAGQNNQQQNATAIGNHAGQETQGYRATAVGYRAGYGDTTGQGEYSVALGAFAGYASQVDNSIAINASGDNLNPTEAGLYIDPIRANNAVGGNVTVYNTTTKEVVSTDVTINNSGITLANGTVISDGESGFFVESLNQANTTNLVFYNAATNEITYGSVIDLDPDNLANNSHTWSVDGDTGALYSTYGTYIADSANSVVIGQNVDVTNPNVGRVAIGENAGQTSQGQHAIAIGADAGTSSQDISAVAIGNGAGETDQSFSAVAVGRWAGQTNQGWDTVAIGRRAGRNNQGDYAVAMGWASANNAQGSYGVAIGESAGNESQGSYAVAIGSQAGVTTQGWGATALGRQAGYDTQGTVATALGSNAGRYNQGDGAVAVGRRAGETTQGYYSTAIGPRAGRYNQGDYAVAIGAYAGDNNQADYSIVLNASSSTLDAATSGFFVNPIAYTAAQDATYDGIMFYNSNTKEVRYSYTLDGGSF